MDAEAEINAVQAESVALQAVVIALSRQILEARPELAPAFCAAFDDAERLMQGIAVRIGTDAPRGDGGGARSDRADPRRDHPRRKRLQALTRGPAGPAKAVPSVFTYRLLGGQLQKRTMNAAATAGGGDCSAIVHCDCLIISWGRKDELVSQIDYLREQAARAQALAGESSLPNVRARFAESAEAWTRLIVRAERLEHAQGPAPGGIGRPPRLLQRRRREG